MTRNPDPYAWPYLDPALFLSDTHPDTQSCDYIGPGRSGDPSHHHPCPE